MNKLGLKNSSRRGSRSAQAQRWTRETLFRRFITRCTLMDFERSEAREWFVGAIAKLLDLRSAALLLMDDSNNELLIYRDEEKRIRPIYHLDFRPDGCIERSMTEETAFTYDAGSGQPAPVVLTPLANPTPERLLCVPLEYKHSSLGAVVLLDKRLGPFTLWDQQFLGQIAGILARSIYTGRLVKQLNVANAELEVNRWQIVRSRNTLRTLFDSVPISIYIIDRDYKLCAVNLDRARRTTEAPNQLVGESCYKAFYGRDDICPDCRAHGALYKGQTLSRVKRQWENETEPLEWEITAYPIFDDAGQVIQAILFEQDVTEKRRLEANLIQSEKLAAVGQLAAGIAHEINNPLTAILANAQMLQREIPEDDDRQELVDLITRAGTRASQVVRNLLDLARKEKYDFAPIDVNKTVVRAIELIQHEIVNRNIDLVFEPAADLPPVLASQDHLQGVWLNLLSNAMDSLISERNEIHITTRRQGNEIFVVIADTGQGIPPETLPRIFEPFYTTKSLGRGTGLGLSLCHRVIKQHGGMIHVDSQVDTGTQFTVVLPLG